MPNLNTVYTFECVDGDKIPMTLTYYALLQLKTKNKGLYERYNQIAMRGAKEELEMITLLYVAYVCALLPNYESCMTEEEFVIKCGFDRMAVKSAIESLMQAKKT